MADNFYDGVYYRAKSNSSKKSSSALLKTKDREIDFFNRIFQPEERTVLLGLGCGSGDYLGSFKDRDIDVWGIDISEIATTSARKKVRKPEQIICADAEKLPFEDEKFDYVTAWGVIEHFPDTNSIIQEVVRVLKPQGTAVIMVPNVYYYKFVWDALCKGEGPVKHQDIEWLYAFQEWEDLLERAGLKVVKCERHNKFNKSGITHWVKKAVPFYFSNHFIFFTKKV